MRRPIHQLVLALALCVSTRRAAADETIEVQGSHLPDEARDSAEAIDVVDTGAQQARAESVGDILARTEGVSVRQAGGLGAVASFSLNGLYDRQVPILLDGIPLDIAGYPQGISNLPVNLIDRVEVYRGVVPIRFGAEALGGAVNLVTHPRYDATGLTASLEAGSYGTYRGSATARYHDALSGLIARALAYGDLAKNDYRIQVGLPDQQGHDTLQSVRLFHSAYHAQGVTLESGFVDQPWAKRFAIGLSFSSFDKELQNNLIQTIPYGGVTNAERILGGTVRYVAPKLLDGRLDVDAVGALSRRRIHLDDQADYVFNWLGDEVRKRATPGETDSVPHDSTVFEDTMYMRAQLGAVLVANHALRIAASARRTTRDGDDPLNDGPDSVDLASAHTSLTTKIGGVEYNSRWWGARIENIVAVKAFAYTTDFLQPLRGGTTRPAHDDDVTLGYGDAFSVRVIEPLTLKASFEHATRAPHPDELFGDGVLVRANPGLVPEQSDNANAGFEGKTGIGENSRVSGGSVFFVRSTQNQILLQGLGAAVQYQNLLTSRSTGVEVYGHAALFDGLLLVDGNFTYQSLRNTSTDGKFAQYHDERLPNRPYLFANGAAVLQLHDLVARGDRWQLGSDVHFVGSFNLSWQSLGDPSTKLEIPDQLTFGAFASATFGAPRRYTGTLEAHNVGDDRVFDFLGVQKPGRSISLKLTVEL